MTYYMSDIYGNYEGYVGMLEKIYLRYDDTLFVLGDVIDRGRGGLMEWQNVGGQITIDEYHKLNAEEKQDIIDYIEEFSIFEEVTVKGKGYVMVHAGLINFAPGRPLEDYHYYELLFMVPDYDLIS